MTYRKGAENVPLQHINKEMQVLVLVYNILTDELVEEKTINYGDAEQRKWLGRISFWAFSNKCSVETMAVADVTPEIKGT